MVKVKPWYLVAAAIVAIVALLLMGQCERRSSAGDVARAEERVRVAYTDSLAKARAVVRADSVFVKDTVRLTKVATKYTILRDSVLVRLTDTVLVRQTIIAADTAIRACREAIDSCTARVAARDSLITTLGQQRAADRKLFDARLRQATPRITPYLEGLVDPTHVDHLTARAGLEVRVLGPVKLVAAGELTRIPSHSDTRALVGVRVTF